MHPSEIEQIVLEVLRRLKTALGEELLCNSTSWEASEPKQPTTSLASLGGTSGLPIRFAKTKYTPDIPATPLASKTCSTGKDVLVCEERLLTLAKIEANLEGLRRLVVHPKAIITPALKEELSRRNIAIERGGARPGTRADFALSVVRFEAEHAPQLHGLGLAEDVSAKSFAVVVNTVASQLAQGNRHVVVLTRKTAAALCVLNRLEPVRAALANNVDAVKGAVKELAANVLVIDPARLGRVQLAAILRAFENEGERNLPGDLCGVLK